ncbi:MAG: dihydrofolate reductase [Pseudohongiellaceae bacterium]
MKIALIVALARNHVIGKYNTMPWHLPEDLRYFKRVTVGKPVIMGRNTYESIGKPLVQRPNIIVSRNSSYTVEGATVVHSLDAALALGADLLRDAGADAELMVIGGAQIYAQALPRADRLYLTEVHAEPAGDASFPCFDRSQWREVAREEHPACERNPYAYDFLVLDRKPA